MPRAIIKLLQKRYDPSFKLLFLIQLRLILTIKDQAAALPETTKKTVRICSVEEEIRIESFDSVDTDELIPFTELQEVQLVTAKILTAEELADSMTKRGEGILTSPMRVSAFIENVNSLR